jgi:glycosyltransferase involved in cell wall biosynthesis
VATKRNNLLIIGPLPEPKGGVSIHITRLSDLLQDQFNIQFIDESPISKDGIFNLHSKNPIGYLRLLLWADIIHIHSGVSLLRFIHVIVSSLLLKKTIVSIHSFTPKHRYEAWATSIILRLANKVLVVSREIANSLKIREPIIKPAFIPPNINREPALPGAIAKWIESRRTANNSVLAANAFRIAFHHGTDLYGIDLCITMMDELVNKQGRPVSLIFILASLAKSEKQFHTYGALIEKLNLASHVMLVHADLSFVKVIEKADIVLRPTCTDGDALTVREALFLGKPVIASDVVSRPRGTILFSNRDHDSMARKVVEVLMNSRPSFPTSDTLSAYKYFYSTLYLA